MEDLKINRNSKYYQYVIDYLNAESISSIKEYCAENSLNEKGFRSYLYANKINKLFVQKRMTDEKLQKIIDEYTSSQLISLKSLADKYQISYPTISKHLKKAGIEIHHVKFPPDQEKLKLGVQYYQKIKNAEKVADMIGIGRRTFRLYLKENNLLLKEPDRQKNVTVNHDYFEKINNPEKAYWLGFIFADGCVLKNKKNNGGRLSIEINEKDEDLLEKFRNSIDSNAKIFHRERCSGLGTTNNTISKTAIFYVCSKKMTDDLIRLGCIPNKTYKGSILTDFNNNKLLIASFLRGYIDGDGSIHKRKWTYSLKIAVKSANIMNKLVEFIHDVSNIVPRIVFVDNQYGGLYNIFIERKENFLKFLDIIYKDASIFLNRKYQRYLEHKLCRPISTIVEEIG